MKRKALALVIILVILTSGTAGTLLINVANSSNAWLPSMPIQTVLSPEQHKTYMTNRLSFSFKIRLESNRVYPQPDVFELVNLHKVWFEADWQKNKTYIDQNSNIYLEPRVLMKPCRELVFSSNLEDIPIGDRNITIYATQEIPGDPDPWYHTTYQIVFFSVNATDETTSETDTYNDVTFPASLVIASVIPVAVVLVGIGLLVYGIKRK